MNKDDIVKSRLLFEIARKKATQKIERDNLVVKTTANSANRCKTARGDFAYERGMTEVEIGKIMLRQNGKLDTSLLTKSVKKVIAKKKVATQTISA